MTKSELFKRMWIPIKKRIPPEDETKWVLIWNYSWEQPMTQQSNIARYGAIAILDETREVTISKDRLFSHWMEIIKP